MLCHLHYAAKPCDQCAARVVLSHIGYNDGPRYHSVIVFKEAVFEHIFHPWEKPHAIDNPETLRQETAARGCESVYLRDSLLWRSRPNRWI